MSKKLDNVRVVTFQDDYTSKAGTTIYKKGSVHAIHQRTVAQLKEKGAKMDVKKFDHQRAVQLAKQAMEN